MVKGFQAPREAEEQVPRLVEAGCVVAGHCQRLRRRRVDRELILELVDRGDVVGVGWIDQDSRRDAGPGRVELFDGHRVLTRLVEDAVDVVVLIDHHHRQVSVAAVGDRQVAPSEMSTMAKLYSVSRFILITG